MTYTFRNTEKNNEKATTFETKSLLYLIGQRKDKKDILYITFDCFNDVSGLNKNFDKIWDVQSKNERNLNPKKIGKYFYTLFDNFISGFSFYEFIFFTYELDSSYKIDSNLKEYDFKNFEKKTSERIINGLNEEIKRVKGDYKIYENEIETFLDKIIIIEDHKTELDYIKSITKFKNKDIKPIDFYNNFFKELRDLQSSKKNSYIENHTISCITDVIDLQRHLSTKDIETLIISRIIGCEVFKFKSIPKPFFNIVKNIEIEDLEDLLQDCNSNLSRALFNKNSNKTFWNTCEQILEFLDIHSSKDTDFVFDSIFNPFIQKISYLNEITLKYLISIIIEGKE